MTMTMTVCVGPDEWLPLTIETPRGRSWANMQLGDVTYGGLTARHLRRLAAEANQAAAALERRAAKAKAAA